MELIVTIIIAVIIKLIKEKSEGNTYFKREKKKNIWDEVLDKTPSDFSNLSTSATTEWQKKARENIAKAAERAKQKSREIGKEALASAKRGATKSFDSRVNYEMPKRMVRTTPIQEQLNQDRMSIFSEEEKELTASEQIRKRRVENKNSSILQRAKQNAAEEAMDETLYSMQIEHGHLETVSLAVHDHSQDLETGDIMETISDLMIKGYEGNLCFERDFLGEAMDMISHFQAPTEIPTYHISEMKF